MTINNKHSHHVIVVGGGVAGIAAALSARSAGARVTLFESLPLLGGRVAGASRIDTGRHLVLSCYDSFLQLLTTLGSREALTLEPLAFSVLVGSQRPSVRFHHPVLAPPLAAGIDLLTGGFLPRVDRLSAVLALARTAAAAPGEPDDRALAGPLRTGRFRRNSRVSVASVFARYRWPDSLQDRFGHPLAIAMGNASESDQPASSFLNALARVLADRQPRAGWIRGEDYGAAVSEPAAAVLPARGVDVRCGEGVRTVERRNGGWTVVADSRTHGDAIVVTVPPARMNSLPETAETAPLLRWSRAQRGRGILTLRTRVKGSPPIAGPIAESAPPYAVWFAEPHPEGGLLLERVISGIENEEVNHPEPWVDEFRLQAGENFGWFVDSERVTVRWYPDATMAQSPGGLRPALMQGPGLYYASDASATGLPATLESAARAGECAGRLAATAMPGPQEG